MFPRRYTAHATQRLMSGKVAITSQIMAAKTRPNGTIDSLFMTASCDEFWLTKARLIPDC